MNLQTRVWRQLTIGEGDETGGGVETDAIVIHLPIHFIEVDVRNRDCCSLLCRTKDRMISVTMTYP